MAVLNGIESNLTTSLGGVSGTGSAASTVAANLAKPAPAGAAKVSSPDQANVSSTGGLVSQALNTSDVRTDKVAALQAAIANGSYNVSSSDVANKIVDSLLR